MREPEMTKQERWRCISACIEKRRMGMTYQRCLICELEAVEAERDQLRADLASVRQEQAKTDRLVANYIAHIEATEKRRKCDCFMCAPSADQEPSKEGRGGKIVTDETPDGELEVREAADGTRELHGTPLGQHMRWLRQAPDLYEMYNECKADFFATLKQRDEDNARLTAERDKAEQWAAAVARENHQLKAERDEARAARDKKDWQKAALRVGEVLATDGPEGYYSLTAEQWREWAIPLAGQWRRKWQAAVALATARLDEIAKAEAQLATLRTKLEGLEQRWRGDSMETHIYIGKVALRGCADDLAAVLKEGV